ncbi:hypothetical protein DEO72_LG5g838 [Vigna unguiculata]|uniref:Uncharacterized protein n=1 Tax=Vigna unguiculata TaxID=3917 RepID=A0A4D6LUN7_VIGUN|nr:hypothetical protein DEO72_LG5g838 [Vigna unguiculata]
MPFYPKYIHTLQNHMLVSSKKYLIRFFFKFILKNLMVYGLFGYAFGELILRDVTKLILVDEEARKSCFCLDVNLSS